MKQNHRLMILAASAAAAALCIGAALISPRPSARADRPQAVQQAPDVQEDPAPSPGGSAKYTAAVYEGHLAIYLNTNTQAPQYVTDVEVSTLPAADREALKKGIPIYTEAQLTAILEDYSS